MKKTLLLLTLAVLSNAHAYEAQVTKGQLAPTIEAMIAKATADTRVAFDLGDFQLVEDRDLATSNFKFYAQTTEMIPVDGTAVRIWTNKATGELILAEMHLDESHKAQESAIAMKYLRANKGGKFQSKSFTSSVQDTVVRLISEHDTDAKVLGMKSQDKWVKGELVRKIEARGRRGIHNISISVLTGRVISNDYLEFPQSENTRSLMANVFPIYEEVEETNEILKTEVKELKYIYSTIPDGGMNPLEGLGSTVFREDTYNPVLAETAFGRENHVWSEASIRKQIETMVANFPLKQNDESSGILLQGKFATIQLHPGIKDAFKDLAFELHPSVHHMLSWVKVDGLYNAVPLSGFYGKTIHSQEELLARVPFRLPDHDPAKYINSGADETQVYYAVTTLMDALAEMGFQDKEISTKPFHAFLYDPDIGMRDNAYYTDNTINFTTYNPKHANLARDNSTIWHELGHGVMERIMGSFLAFGDTKGGYGGLSEGMADFVAKIITEHQTNGQDFPGKYDYRIMNQTGFYLPNEFHDEGEAYGGAMSDMLLKVISLEGRKGLFAFTDLTLEAMRLTRDHPSLVARIWFEHMLYADELGSANRAPGQYRDIIIAAVGKRNFSFDKAFKPAQLKIITPFGELTNISASSREKPSLACDPSGTAAFNLKVSLTEGDSKFLAFPATVKVEYHKGALQGAIKWEGEESNPTIYEIKSASDVLDIPLKVSMSCDSINQPDGSCKDYAYIQVWYPGEKKPRAKKRFYLKVNPKNPTCVASN